jgi:alpha-tubulin suppressor-like RCC1 family protein
MATVELQQKWALSCFFQMVHCRKIGKEKRCSFWRNNPGKIANFVWVQALANLLHHYFLCKEGLLLQWGGNNTGIIGRISVVLIKVLSALDDACSAV